MYKQSAATRLVSFSSDNEKGTLIAPNDVTFDGKGRIYFSDKPAKNTGEGGVYRIDLDGRITRILAPPEIEAPNGLIISPDDKTLYLIEANQAEKGVRVIRAYDLRADGTVTGMRVFHNFYPGRSGEMGCRLT